jgi:hypothetical protein
MAVAWRPPAAEPEPARFSAAAAGVAALAQHLAEPEVWAEQAAARQPEESAAQRAAAVLAEVAASDAQAEQPRAAARDAAEEPRPEAEVWDAAVVLRQEEATPAGAEAVARRREARDEVEVLPRAAPGAQGVVHPLADPSVFHRDQAPPWPAPSLAVLFANAMERMRIASL